VQPTDHDGVRAMTRLAVLLTALAAGCTTTPATTGQPDGGGGGGGGGDDGGIPATEACSGDVSSCIGGTFTTTGFSVGLAGAHVELHRVYPYGTPQPLAVNPVALDGTYAFNGLAAWGHYYLRAVGKFTPPSGNAVSIDTVVGPVTIPSTGPVALVLKPVEIELLESETSQQSLSFEWASAHVFDPASGAELTDATVTLSAGGQQLAMPYGTNISGGQSYFVQPSSSVPAAATYTLQVTDPIFSAAQTWQLVAAPPSYQAGMVAPLDGAKIPVGQALAVSWQPEPASDYAVVELFQQQGSSYASRYTSPLADGPDVTQETIPGTALAQAGTYLLNVQVARASCPVTADGCVYGASITGGTLTAQ
jgi:hypothetical protein